MFSIKITTVALVALFSATSLAAATPNSVDTATIHQLDTRDWISVEFGGKTVMYNPSAVNAPSEDTEGAVTAKRDDNDVCTDTSYSNTGGPWPSESDCATLGDWASRNGTTWAVKSSTPDYHGIIGVGNCVFGAGTRNHFGAYIGSSDISSIISESIKKYAVCYIAPKSLLALIFTLTCCLEQCYGRR